LNDLLGDKSEQKYFTGSKSKNILQGVKPKMTYITGGKASLTLFLWSTFHSKTCFLIKVILLDSINENDILFQMTLD